MELKVPQCALAANNRDPIGRQRPQLKNRRQSDPGTIHKYAGVPGSHIGRDDLTALAKRAASPYLGTGDFEFIGTATHTGPTTLDTRSFTSFSQARGEVVETHILEGDHFRFSDQKAKKQGELIA